MMKWMMIVGVVMSLCLHAGAMTDEDVRGAFSRSYWYERLQDYDAAVKALSLVVESDPHGYSVNMRLGWLFYLKANYANSKASYQDALKVAPESIETRTALMLPLLAQLRYGDVESLSREVLLVDPGNYTANLRLAYALRLQGKITPAEKVLEPMLRRYPNDLSLLLEMGMIRVAQDRKSAAREVMTKILLLDPENVTAKSLMATTLLDKHAATIP